MASYPEHSHRWQHRTHATVTGHWHGDHYTLGTVEACDECETDCGAQYGSNPDLCYQPKGHRGTHSNRWGTTWEAS